MGIDILGIDIMGVDILGIDIPALPPHNVCFKEKYQKISIFTPFKNFCIMHGNVCVMSSTINLCMADQSDYCWHRCLTE